MRIRFNHILMNRPGLHFLCVTVDTLGADTPHLPYEKTIGLSVEKVKPTILHSRKCKAYTFAILPTDLTLRK